MRFPVLVLTLILTESVRAATNAPAGLQPERWLMVVDVSSPMKNRAPAVNAAVAGLLNSSMNGQLLEGHEIGLWTFNDQLHTDMDVMKWMDFRTNAIKQRLMNHLAEQKYGRQPSFGETLENMKAIVADSRRLTLILISDGDEPFPGTLFETTVAEFFRANREEARSGKVPIVTVLRGSRGKWAGLAQSYPPWPVTFPEFPPEPAPVVRPQAPAPVTSVPRTNPPSLGRPVIVAEPLVVRGPDPLSKEIEEKGLATNTANIVLQKPPPPSPPPEPVITNEPVAAENPVEPEPTWSRPVVEPANPEPRPVWSMIGAAGGLLAVAILVILVLRRRVSNRHRTSLITRSMNGDRDKP